MKKTNKIYVAGHKGLVGSAIIRKLLKSGYNNVLCRTRNQLNLCRQDEVERFFADECPEYVFLAAARVGGIHANSTNPVQFIYDNLMINTNIICAAYTFGVKKLLFLGSSCVYPKFAPQPLKEQYLLTGELEPTNEPYAIAKIAGIKLCEAYNRQYNANFFSVMPTNIYGQNDNFDLETSHVVPALIRKFHEAKINNKPVVEIWGTGEPRREFLFVDDLADACVLLMERYDYKDIGGYINIGTAEDLTIRELAELISEIVGFNGRLVFNTDKPDGTPRKILDISKIKKLGWKARTSLKDGINEAYKWYVREKVHL